MERRGLLDIIGESVLPGLYGKETVGDRVAAAQQGLLGAYATGGNKGLFDYMKTPAYTGPMNELGGAFAGSVTGKAAQRLAQDLPEGIGLNVKSRPDGSAFVMVGDTNWGGVGGEQIGDTLRVTHSEIVNPADRGKGYGVAMYEKLIDYARQNGLKLTSDLTVEPPAARVYDALERRGYPVQRHPDTVFEPPDGDLSEGLYYASGMKEGPFSIDLRAMTPARSGGIAAKAGAEGKAAVAASHALPMDEASRIARARDMGFDISPKSEAQAAMITDARKMPLYHITGSDVSSFELGHDPSSHSGGGAIWLRTDPKTNPAAHQVSGHSTIYADGANDMPLVISDRLSPLPTQTMRDMVNNGELNGAFPYVITMAENKKLRDMGYGLVHRLNEVAVLDPTAIRSRFAAFDPAKADSADLLAARGPMTGPREDERKRKK